MIPFDSYPFQRSGVLSKRVGEEMIFVLSEKHQAKVVNELGSFVWPRLDGRHRVDEIAQEISAEYEVDYEQVISDLLDFLGEMLAKEVITVSNQPFSPVDPPGSV